MDNSYQPDPKETGQVSNLAEIERLTRTLDDLVKVRLDSVVDYRVAGGESIGTCLYNTPEVAVQRAFATKGACYALHAHAGQEYVIIYKGKATINKNGVLSKLLPGECVHFAPGEGHTFTADENTWMIGITIPSDKGYPHNGTR